MRNTWIFWGVEGGHGRGQGFVVFWSPVRGDVFGARCMLAKFLNHVGLLLDEPFLAFQHLEEALGGSWWVWCCVMASAGFMGWLSWWGKGTGCKIDLAGRYSLVSGSHHGVSIRVVRNKDIFLFFSTLDITESNFDNLIPIYNTIKTGEQYKILWVPIVEEWNDELRIQFESLNFKMFWYVLQHFEPIRGIRFIKEELQFTNKHTIVLLSPQTKILHLNAFYMIEVDKTTNSATQEVQKLFSYKNESGWTLLTHGSTVLLSGHGTAMLKTVSKFDNWKKFVIQTAFEISFKEHYEKVILSTRIWFHNEIPKIAGKIPDFIECPECHCKMEVFVSCCRIEEEKIDRNA
ncbi:unnamed protein product [Lupinus luteus]|uniref:Sieve element occlusion C-terminal domain-containing protein n=1 Tax=Lupinus luteus TaxID=3873 RepID=A0AAV1VSA0_LUPLU